MATIVLPEWFLIMTLIVLGLHTVKEFLGLYVKHLGHKLGHTRRKND